jgi:hypothetical protein
MMASQIMIMVVIEEDDTVVKLSVHYYCIIAAVEFVMTVDLPAANIGIHICISNTACSALSQKKKYSMFCCVEFSPLVQQKVTQFFQNEVE